MAMDGKHVRVWLTWPAVLLGLGCALAASLQGRSAPADEWPAPLWASALDVAAAEAAAWRKPLLVLLAIEDRNEGRIRGDLLGEMLQRCSREQAAALALCEVAVARAEDVQRRFPGLEFPAKSLGLLIEPGSPAACKVFTAGPATQLPDGSLGIVDGDPSGNWRESLVTLIGRTEAELAVRAAAQRDGLQPVADGIAAALERRESLPDWALDRWAPVVLAWASRHPDRREELEESLAALARAELVERAPRGASWVQQDGFVYTVDGKRTIDACPPCGMGHSTERGRRFLSLYAGQEIAILGK